MAKKSGPKFGGLGPRRYVVSRKGKRTPVAEATEEQLNPKPVEHVRVPRITLPIPEFSDVRTQLATLERIVHVRRCREKLLDFAKYMMPDPERPDDFTASRYEATYFHTKIAEALEQVEKGEVQQLIFCMPPRHGKTQLATKLFAAWIMGRHPEWDLGVASYSDTMAQDFGADTRAVLTSPQFKAVFPEFTLRRGGSAKDNIQTSIGGRAVFVGRGGALTGRGMHVGLGDDLFKDHEEARSQTIRDAAWNWFTKVFMTRRMGPKLVVLTMTRWHSDDIIGRITDPENPCYNEIEAKKWKIIRLPAIAEHEDPLGRPEGKELWPERYDLEFLQSQQRLDPLGFAALYQQRPTVADGVLFRRETIQFYRPGDLPDSLTYYCASDHAVGEKQRNDPSCFIKIGVDRQDNIWIIDCDWRRMAADVAVEAMLAMGGGARRPVLWWAEKGHISKAIGPFLRKRMAEEGVYINLVEVTPSVDKTQRAQSIAGRVAQGKVYFPRDAVWSERAVNELLAFPNGTHDDFVDALAYIGIGLGHQFRPSAPQRASQEPKFGTLDWVKRQEKWSDEQARERRYGGF